ncbi:hypothetical protein Gotur_017700, partial [Gossypium turneri]
AGTLPIASLENYYCQLQYLLHDDETEVPWSAEEIIKGSYSWAKQYASLPKINSIVKQKANVEHNWTNRWMQLRTDGSVKVDSSFAVVGGTLRDNHGCGSLALVDGLSLVQEKQGNKVLIQMDSLEAIKAN